MVGIGIMGSRMGARLIDAGFGVRGYDPDPDRLAAFEQRGGVASNSPADAAEGCSVVLMSVLTSDISKQVCLGDGGIHETTTRPLIVLDTTTGWPADTEEIAAAMAEVGIEYCDMTVSGNAPFAERGDLTVMFGGSEDAFASAQPVMDVIGRSAHRVGPVGSGTRAKLIINHVLAVNRASIAEGLVSAERAGMDLEAVLGVLRDSAAYSKAMELWGDRMVAGNHEQPNARVQQSYKDSRLIADFAASNAAPSQLIDFVRDTWAEGVEGGLGELDNSSFIEVLRRRAGIGRVETGDDIE